MRAEVASVDSESFYEFALKFLAHVRHLTSNGRHILLTYDAF